MAAAPAPPSPSGAVRTPYVGERHLGREFYSKRFRLLTTYLVESGPPPNEPALLHGQEVRGRFGRGRPV